MDDLLPEGPAPVERRTARMPGRGRASLVIALVAFVLVAGGALWASGRYQWCRTAPEPTGATVTVEVPAGATGAEVVETLADQGLINCGGFVGNLLLRGTGQATAIRTGVYDLAVGLTLDEILMVLTTPPPKVPTYEVLFPEGLRIRRTYPGERTISTVAAKEAGLSAERFARLAESGRYRLDPYLPKSADTAEGFLFPATYRFVKEGLTEERVIDEMLAEFGERAAGLPWEHAKELGLTPYEVVIVASMIEREAANDDERALIAGVIYNRLRDGIALGIDATLLYMDPSPDGELTTADIETDNPYNTRINAGLPPTPIASPGERSLEAALSPEETTYLYYVLCPPDGDGHRFAETLAEHEANVVECLG
jgi:UPF0755 protein